MQQIREYSIHCHSKIEDEYDSVEDMIIAAKNAGLNTIGIFRPLNFFQFAVSDLITGRTVV